MLIFNNMIRRIYSRILPCLFILSCICGYPISQPASTDRRLPYENLDLFEGDILLPDPSFVNNRGVALAASSVRWPNGIVPYEFRSGYSAVEEAYIVATMRKMERQVAINNVVCIQFRPRIVTDPYYVVITNGTGCSAHVGQNAGLNFTRTVTLQRSGCLYEAIIMHELLHTLGFLHEQSRSDRDSYVTVNYANIIPGYQNNFNKYNSSMTNTLGTPYDYASVMHYEPQAFSRNGQPTITPLQTGATIGQRYNMSTIDIQEVQLFYNCSSSGTPLTPITPEPGANAYLANETVSSTWTSSSRIYTRYGARTTGYHYDTFDVRVSVSDTYIIWSTSSIDAYGYLYNDVFYPTHPSINLFAVDDDSGGNNQFQMAVSLQANALYVLVATTSNPSLTGSYTITVSGPSMASIIMTNTTSVYVPTTRPPGSTAVSFYSHMAYSLSLLFLLY